MLLIIGYLIARDNRYRDCARATFLCCVFSVFFICNIVGNFRNDSEFTKEERDLTWFCN